jgi:hypothetical protein
MCLTNVDKFAPSAPNPISRLIGTTKGHDNQTDRDMFVLASTLCKDPRHLPAAMMLQGRAGTAYIVSLSQDEHAVSTRTSQLSRPNKEEHRKIQTVMPKLVTVVGATGIQGGSVIRALLKHPEYTLRAITRNVQSPQARALADQGVEVVKADLNDTESLKAAFEGSYGIYAVTNFFEAFPTVGKDKAIDIEAQLGANLADAAAATTSLQHFIWSSLPDSRKNSGGKVVVPHYEGKNRVDRHIRSIPELHDKTTFIWILWYGQNIRYPFYQPFQIPGTSGDTLYQLQATPGSSKWKLSGDAETNIGLFVKAILEKPEKTLPSKYVLAASDDLTADEVVQTWAEVQGKKGKVLTLSREAYYGIWPMWSEAMDLSHTYLGLPGAYSQGDEHVLMKEDLGVEGLVSTKEYFQKLQAR